MTPEEIKEITKTCLQDFTKEKEWIDKDYLSRYLSSISDLKKFFDDITTLSVAIIGIVFPILIQSKIDLDKTALIISVMFFSMEIILWIIYRFYIIKKEIEKWPIEKNKVDKKYDDTINDLKELNDNPNYKLQREITNRIKNRYSGNIIDYKKNKSLFKKLCVVFLNINYWLLVLFILAFILLISSFSPLFLEILQDI